MKDRPISHFLLKLSPALIFILFAFTTPVTSENGGFGFDGRFYTAMVSRLDVDSFQVFHPPYCWRILSPYLASLIPIPPLAGLGVLNALSTLTTLFLVLRVLEELKLKPFTQFVGLSLYSTLFFSVQAAFYTPAMIDPLGLLFLWLTLLLTFQKRYLLVCAVVFLAAFQKEGILFITPIAYLIKAKEDGEYQRNLLFFALLIVCALVPIGLLKALIEPSVQYQPEAVLRLTFIKQFLSLSFYPRFLISIFAGLGVLPLLLLSFRKQVLPTLKEHPYILAFFVLGAVQLLGGTCKARLLMGMVPGFILLIAFIIDKAMAEKSNSSLVRLLTVVIAIQLLLSFSGVTFADEHQLRAWILPTYTPPPLTSSFIRIMVLLGLWFPIHYSFQRISADDGRR